MDGADSGLVYRVKRAARQIAEQHAHMDEILRGFPPLLEKGEVAAARELFRRYRGAVDAHFSLEDGVFFPAVHGLRPECAVDIEALGAEHVGFLADLERLSADLEADLLRFGRGLRAVARELSAHESREERLMRRVSGPPDQKA